jgi:pimeloyl-ACP methyl ester carboxylesterase
MFEGFTRGHANIDGVDIAYVVGGSGPPVLLLHGFPQSKALWARVAPQLADHYTIVCADLRGYGDSAKPKCLPDRSNYSFRAMAADQIGLMRRLGFERFHMVGHDRGARTVLPHGARPLGHGSHSNRDGHRSARSWPSTTLDPTPPKSAPVTLCACRLPFDPPAIHDKHVLR